MERHCVSATSLNTLFFFFCFLSKEQLEEDKLHNNGGKVLSSEKKKKTLHIFCLGCSFSRHLSIHRSRACVMTHGTLSCSLLKCTIPLHLHGMFIYYIVVKTRHCTFLMHSKFHWVQVFDRVSLRRQD